MAATFHDPSLLRIPQALLRVIERKLRVPRFQRGYVWKDSARLELLDSVYRGVPLGSVMVWETADPVASADQLGPWRFAAEPPSRDPAPRDYIIDGQQRLVTLLASLGGGLLRDKRISPMEWAPPDPSVRWRVFFDLRGDDPEPVLERRGREPPTYWLPLDHVFDPVRLGAFQRALKSEEQVYRSDEVAGRFKDYALMQHKMSNVEREKAQEYFERLNRTGARVSYVDLVHARVWSEKLDIRQEIEGLRDLLRPFGWQGIDERALLDVARLFTERGQYSSGTGTFERDLVDNPELLGRVKARILAAVRFLREDCDIGGAEVLPYLYQLEILSAVVEDEQYRAPDARRLLRDWVLATTYAEYFPSKRRVKDAREDIGESLKTAKLVLRDRPETVVPQTEFSPNSARSLGFALCLLRQLRLHGARGRFETLRDALGRDPGGTVLRLLPREDVPAGWNFDSPANCVIVEPTRLDPLRDSLAGSGAPWSAVELSAIAIPPEAVARLRAAPSERGVFLRTRAEYLQALERTEAEAAGLKYEVS